MFNKDYTAEYDVFKTLQTIKAATFAEAPDAEYWYQDNLSRVAEILGTYFEDVAKGLEDRGFGKDDMLQEGFVEAAGKVRRQLDSGARGQSLMIEGQGIVRFEFTDKLPVCNPLRGSCSSADPRDVSAWQVLHCHLRGRCRLHPYDHRLLRRQHGQRNHGWRD
jgi:hypothetical protein